MKKSLVIIFALLILITGLFLYTKLNNSQKHFQVTFFNIGQGDSALIKFGNGQKMLVDCGSDRKILSKLGRALPFYDRTIDYVLATHPDLDHYGGCVDVLKNYNVKEIIINGRKKEYDPYWRVWDEAVKEEGAVVKIISHPEELIIASSTLQFMSPDNSLPLDVAADDNNNYSIVFKLKNDRTSFLFTGDMEEPLEKALVQKYCSTPTPSSSPSRAEGDTSPSYQEGATGELPRQSFTCSALQSDVLKIGHHGSDTASGEYFLNLVNPKTAIISVGKNKYGHPSLRVMKKLERVGTEILRTDEKGDIIPDSVPLPGCSQGC